jgi:hypothetical protein
MSVQRRVSIEPPKRRATGPQHNTVDEHPAQTNDTRSLLETDKASQKTAQNVQIAARVRISGKLLRRAMLRMWWSGRLSTGNANANSQMERLAS